MGWIALIAMLLVFTLAQEVFYEVHRRRHGLWRSTRERRLWASPDERALMWQEATRRNPDSTVELVRLVALSVMFLCIAGLFAIVFSGALSGR